MLWIIRLYRKPLVLAALVLCAGCATQNSHRNATSHETKIPLRIRRLAAIYDNIWKEQERIAYACLQEAISQTGSDIKPQYRRSDFRLLSAYRIIPQEPFPRGAEILRAYVSQSGIDEVNRSDMAVTVYIIPGKRPAYLAERIPSKGALTRYHHVYDLGHPYNVLVISESGPGQLGGSIRFILWDVLENRVKCLQYWAGEQDGRDFCHEMHQHAKTPELVIRGFYSVKRTNKAYDEDRMSLEKAVGMPVRLVYDGDAD